jgi:uncharacterized protein (TIGR02757 family)
MVNKKKLDELYEKYNSRRFVHPDPLEFLYRYDDPCDREIVGMVASSLAYGRVAQILKSVSYVLDQMSSHPSIFLKKCTFKSLNNIFSSFKHRFTTGEELSLLLFNIKGIIEQYGSLNECFAKGFSNRNGDDTILQALLEFIRKLGVGAYGCRNSLIPSPNGRCAYKRLNLFLRWMVRRDNVDPGDWNNIPTSKLIIPLDTHMYKISLFFKLTERKQADIKTALEITNAFRKIVFDDPVKYDFALTRLGIHKEFQENFICS